MLILLPILVFVIIYLNLLGLEENAGLAGSWRKVFLLSAAVWGGGMSVMT